MELIGLLSNVIKENLKTKKILLEYPESTVKKLVDKFSKQTDETEDEIRQVIADFERFKAAFDSQDKDIFRHDYNKVKQLIKDKSTKQKTKKDLEGITQEYIQKNKGADLQLSKLNIKKFFEVKTQLPDQREFKRDVLDYNPSELNALIETHFNKVDRNGVNKLIATISQKFHNENPDEDPFTAIVPRAKRFVKHFNLIPLNSKLSKFMTFEEFEHIVDGYTPVEESEYDVPEIETDDIDISYEDDNVLIFAPDQKQKCINIRKKFAPDRRWCTSWEGSSNYYYNYRLNQNLTLYYVIQKNLPTSDLNYATVILVDKHGDMRLADGSNSGRYAGGTELPWSEIVGKVPELEGKKEYLVAKPYSDADMDKLKRYKSYNLSTTDPIAELGSEEEVELWLELRSPDLKSTTNGDLIFGNLPEELQKKYIGLGNELTGNMVRQLSPGALAYYVSKKKEKLLQKPLKDLNESDIETILSKEMRPYAKALKEKYTAELENSFNPEMISLIYPNDATAKYVVLYGIQTFFNIIPEDTTHLQVENKSETTIAWDIPEDLGRFTQIETLAFENCIKSLPESIGKLQNLTFLNIGSNKELRTLPESLADLVCLNFVNTIGTNLDVSELPEKIHRYFSVGEDYLDPNFPEEMRGNC